MERSRGDSDGSDYGSNESSNISLLTDASIHRQRALFSHRFTGNCCNSRTNSHSTAFGFFIRSAHADESDPRIALGSMPPTAEEDTLTQDRHGRPQQPRFVLCQNNSNRGASMRQRRPSEMWGDNVFAVATASTADNSDCDENAQRPSSPHSATTTTRKVGFLECAMQRMVPSAQAAEAPPLTAAPPSTQQPRPLNRFQQAVAEGRTKQVTFNLRAAQPPPKPKVKRGAPPPPAPHPLRAYVMLVPEDEDDATGNAACAVTPAHATPLITTPADAKKTEVSTIANRDSSRDAAASAASAPAAPVSSAAAAAGTSTSKDSSKKKVRDHRTDPPIEGVPQSVLDSRRFRSDTYVIRPVPEPVSKSKKQSSERRQPSQAELSRQRLRFRLEPFVEPEEVIIGAPMRLEGDADSGQPGDAIFSPCAYGRQQIVPPQWEPREKRGSDNCFGRKRNI